MNESKYQAKLINKLRVLLPGCFILKNDPQYIQGVPDILVLYEDKWAALEIKFSYEASIQPNQKYYISLLHDMSFASFINPENEEDVLYDLQLAFGLIREARTS